MASTLIQIRDLVKVNAGIVQDPDFPNTLLNRWINDAQRDVQLKLFHLGYKEFKSTDALTLTASKYSSGTNNVQTSPLSSDVQSRMGVPNWLIEIECTDSSTYGVAYPVAERVFKEHLVNSFLVPTLTNPICAIIADKIYIAPVTVTGATAHYYKETTDMSGDSSAVDLPESFVPFITRLVEIRVQNRKGKLSDKESAMIEFDKALADSLKALQIMKVEDKEEQNIQLQ